MIRLCCITLVWLSLAATSAAETVHCTTREEPAFKRWVTTCTDGARSITRWNQAFKRWDTEIVTPPKAHTPPRGSPLPGKPPR
jgi:hypothetical protein